MDFKSWTTWALIIVTVICAVVNIVFPTIGLQAPASYTPMALTIWGVTLAFKILTLLGVGVGAAYGIKKHIEYKMSLAPQRSFLPRAGDTAGDLASILKSIYAGLDGDGIPYKITASDGTVTIDPVPIAPQLSRVLANIWNDTDYSMAIKLQLLGEALKTCVEAFTKVTKLTPPTTFLQVADYNAYWRGVSVTCAVSSEALFRQIIMPLRTVLKIRDTGDV